MTRRPLATLGSALAVASLGLTLDNLRRLRTPPVPPPPLTEPLAVLVPARDEAEHIGPCLDALRRGLDTLDPAPSPTTGAPAVQVLVLDDDSSDSTAATVEAVAAVDPRVRLLHGKPVPEGWLAKPWACHQLAAAAHPDTGVLLFVDADVLVAPDGPAGAVALLRGAGLDLVSPWPHQDAEGPVERLVQPLLAWAWLSMLPLGLAERSPRPALGAANGQLLAVDAAAYRRAGGHDAVRADVLDDIALLRAVKRSGGRAVVADGTDLATCRMYLGGRALREGYAKSLWAAFGSRAGAAGVLALLGLAHVVPAAAALRGSRIGMLGYAAGVAGRVLAARRIRGRPADALAHPLSVLALAALTADSWHRRRVGGLRWRGRPVVPEPATGAPADAA